MNSAGRVIDKTNVGHEDNKVCNCLIFTTNEDYEIDLCKSGHNFFAFNHPELKSWDSEEYKLPENYFILPENEIPTWIRWDVIIIQNKLFQFQTAEKIKKILQVPLIVVEHSRPIKVSKMEQQIDIMRTMLGDINVFSDEKIAEEWEIDYNNYIIGKENFTIKWEMLIKMIYERAT